MFDGLQEVKMSRKTRKVFVMCAAVVLIFAVSAVAGSNRVAEVSVGSNGIHWLPKVSGGKIFLTVSRPDGTVFSKTFESGGSAYFDLSENKGSIVDGSYNYELRLVPNEVKLRKAGEIDGNPGLRDSRRTTEPLVQSGAFTVRGGSIVTGGFLEPGKQGNRNTNPAIVQGDDGPELPDDQVILDDLIVDGSICVGMDCVNGESFGFDTIRLKENNLRIRFVDTSSTSSFPSRDWQITVNDSANGGGNYFAIEDIDGGRKPFLVEAGAPTSSLYVDDGGRVGLGTSTPVVQLHVKDGNTPTLRLEQDGSSGFTPQTWDVAGNEANFFIRDATNGSTLPFRIRPGAPSSSIDIDSDGNVGIGTDDPLFELHVVEAGNSLMVVENTSSGISGKFAAAGNAVQIGSRGPEPLNFLVNNSLVVMRLNADTADGQVGIGIDMGTVSHLLHLKGGAYCDGGDWINGSSREYKKDIENLDAGEALNTLEGLTPVKFKYKKDDSDGHVGFIAEDVPDLVASKDRKGMSPMDVVAVLTKVVQKQQETIDSLNKRIVKLEKKSQKDK